MARHPNLPPSPVHLAAHAPVAHGLLSATALPPLDASAPGTTMISEWGLTTEARQRAALQAIERTWNARPWPEGLRSYHVFPSIDGATLLHYSRWTEDAAFEAFVARHRDARVDVIDTEVPDIVRDGLGRFDLYRSHHAQAASAPTGCMAVVRVEAASAALQRAWIDAVCDALDGDQIPGLIAAHFHVCDDGRIVNLAQWESEEAQDRAMAGRSGLAQRDSPAWARVRTMPGITQKGMKRFHLPHAIGGFDPTRPYRV